MGLEPGEDVFGELAIVRTGFEELAGGRAGGGGDAGREPGGELIGEEFAKEFADGDAGVEVATLTDDLRSAFVVAEFGMVERGGHEARAGEGAGAGDFRAQKCGEWRRILAVVGGIGYDTRQHKTGRFLWLKLTPSST